MAPIPRDVAWRRKLGRWLELASKTARRSVVVEVSIGRRASEICARVECAEGQRVEDLAGELEATLEDLMSDQTRAVTYTVRARGADELPVTSLELELPPPSTSSERAPDDPRDKVIAQLQATVTQLHRHVEALTVQLVTVSKSQHEGYSSVIGALTTANRASNEELNNERIARRDAQQIAGEAVSKIEELNGELSKHDRDASRISLLAESLVETYLSKIKGDDDDGKSKNKKRGVLKVLKGAVDAASKQLEEPSDTVEVKAIAEGNDGTG